jgi:TonB family protein
MHDHWHHITLAVWYLGEKEFNHIYQCNFYVDGKLQYNSDVKGIGTNTGWNFNYRRNNRMEIDNIRIYSRLLSAKEVTTIYEEEENNQSSVTLSDKLLSDNNNTVTVHETMPEFPGGNERMYQWISENVNYPQITAKERVSGKVVAKFCVQKDGTISDIQILESLSPPYDQEVIRLLRSMPQWKPGTQDGNPIPVYFTFPIKF